MKKILLLFGLFLFFADSQGQDTLTVKEKFFWLDIAAQGVENVSTLSLRLQFDTLAVAPIGRNGKPLVRLGSVLDSARAFSAIFQNGKRNQVHFAYRDTISNGVKSDGIILSLRLEAIANGSSAVLLSRAQSNAKKQHEGSRNELTFPIALQKTILKVAIADTIRLRSAVRP